VAIIADLRDDSLPLVRDAFEGLTNSKAHDRPRYGDSFVVLSFYPNFLDNPTRTRIAVIFVCVTLPEDRQIGKAK
jgi:hypothetical protein